MGGAEGRTITLENSGELTGDVEVTGRIEGHGMDVGNGAAGALAHAGPAGAVPPGNIGYRGSTDIGEIAAHVDITIGGGSHGLEGGPI